MSKKYLSYTAVSLGERCRKAFFLSLNHPEFKDAISEERKVLLNQSRELKVKARDLFPGGIKVEKDINNLEKAANDTLFFIQSGETILYDAVFIFEGIFVVIDILLFESGNWKFFEVKNSLRINNGYFKEMSFVHLAIKNTVHASPDAFLITINSDFVLNKDSTVIDLFHIQNVSKQIRENLYLIETKIKNAKILENITTLPEEKIGNKCISPYDCDFIKYCWKEIPDESVLKINGLPFPKRVEFFDSGKKTIHEIDDFEGIPTPIKNQIVSVRNKEERVEWQKLMTYVSKICFPAMLFDMEFLSSAIPKISGTRPFEQIPFAFTSFLIDSNFEKIDEVNFVSDPSRNLEQDLVGSLLPMLSRCKSIVVYDKGMELAWIKKIKKENLHLDFIKETNKPIIDLYEPIRKGYYYHYLMQGKYSLKQVYKAITKKSFNDNKLISSGLIASQVYHSLFSDDDPVRRDTIIQQLKEYSRADVDALFELLLKFYRFQMH